jgi:hypothetical protein
MVTGYRYLKNGCAITAQEPTDEENQPAAAPSPASDQLHWQHSEGQQARRGPCAENRLCCALKRPKPTIDAQKLAFQLIDQFLNPMLGSHFCELAHNLWVKSLAR